MIALRQVAAVVTDIEGTTSSLAFVKEQLFPYARRELPNYVRAHAAELGEIGAQIQAAAGRDTLGPQEMIDLLLQWMEQDRKITPLKTMQGWIWRSGYERGDLQGHVYEDAARALRLWHARGIRIYLYSSGSIEAQRLLFAHSSQGDLTPLLSGYFDTTTGPKLDADSYRAIGRALRLAPEAIVFLSDHSGETHAAAEAGMRTVLLARERNTRSALAVQPTAGSFDEIDLNL